MSELKVTVVDYGMGNLLSVQRAFEHCGAEVELTDNPRRIANAERLVLPGVGAFANCMAGLKLRHLVEPVRSLAGTDRPFLGICVGMQILLEESEEFGRCEGLGLIPGRVEAIPRTTSEGRPHKVPHIGWTAIHQPEEANGDRWAGSILEPVAPGSATYFVHSYTAVPANPADRLADSRYNGRLVSAAIARDNICATQFHPEKSGEVGLAMIRRFLAL